MTSEVSRLIQAHQRGEPTARARIIELVYPTVREMVHAKLATSFRRNNRWMLSAFSTGDIVQDVFLRVVGSLDGLDGRDEPALLNFLAKAVHNRLVDMLRYHNAGRRDVRVQVRQDGEASRDGLAASIAAPESSPSQRLIAREHLQVYNSVLDRFPAKVRQTLRLRLEEGLGFAAIAVQVGYANAEVACKAFHVAQARLLVRMRSHGIRSPLSES